MPDNRKNWPKIIEGLNNNPNRRLRFAMGTPGSAQVTRCRLLDEWNNLKAWTVGHVLYVELQNGK